MGFVSDRFLKEVDICKERNTMTMKEYILALSTCPESKSQALAQLLVERKVCACVNIISKVTSIYHWKNKIETDTESILLMKTEARFQDILENTIIENHPYEVPEIIFVAIKSGSKDYLDWISSNLLKR
jgi:periplasmic divalent cation tolerance protein